MTKDHDASSKGGEKEVEDKRNGPDIVRSLLSVGTSAMANALHTEDIEVIRFAVRQFTATEVNRSRSTAASAPRTDDNHRRVMDEPPPSVGEKSYALAAFVRSIMASKGGIGEKEIAALVAAGYSELQVVDISIAVSLTIFVDVLDSMGEQFDPLR